MDEQFVGSTSAAEAEELVRQLYRPGSPSDTARIQEELQILQRSPIGWQLADVFLASADEPVQFFGALTFTVKLNSDWETLDENGARDLLHRLLYWLIRLVSAQAGAMVTRKLCTTLVVYFLRFPLKWAQEVRHVISCLDRKDVVPLDVLDQLPATEDILARMKPQELLTALWFSAAFVEEIDKLDTNTLKNQPYHQGVLRNATDAVALMRRCLALQEGEPPKMSSEAVKCFQSWIFYSQRAFIDKQETVDILTSLTQLAMRCLVQDNMFECTVELFTDVLSYFSAFLTPDDMQLLSTFFRSQWTEDRLGRLMRGDFEYENVQFGRFLLAYGDATLQDLARKCEDDQSKYILTILHGLLRCKGVAVVDDEICTNALEFWTAFVEFMVDSTYAGDQEEAWFQPARAHVVETFQDCLVKIRVPDPSIVAAWDSDFRTGFKDFRKDSADLVEASYPILGAEIFIEVVELVLAALERKEWQEVEAALFCLNALSDCYSGGPNEQAALESLFKSSIFSLREDGQAGVPAKARETLVALLGNYSSFFETRPDYLSPAMHFLFQCLEVPSSAISASKSIASLGSSCRHALSSNIDAFILYLENLLSQGSIDHIVKDKVFGAVASVIQALPTDEAKARCLQRLIYLVQQDVSICLRHVGAQEVSEAEEAGTTALQCLSSIGKGMRGFLEAAIDLTSDTPRGSLFWDQVEGATLQAQIVGLVDAICGSMPLNGAVIEAACSVFKSGLSETTPGPFVFPAHVTTGFLLKSQVSTPRVGLVVATACSLISSHSNEGSTRIDGEANALLAHFVGFIQQLGAPENDPDVAQNCIDFLTRLLSRYANVLVQFEPQSLLQEVLIFTLRCMAGVDILPKRASATFWASFIGIDPQPDVAQSAINNILEHLGSSVAEAIIINVGGHAARSDLDTVAEPLKRMVFHHVKAKTWLAQALFNPNFPSAKVNDEQKRLFLQQVMLLRGAKGTNQVVKEFWIACRGMSFSYAS